MKSDNKTNLTNARKEAEEESLDGSVYCCEACSNTDTVIKSDGKYVCKFCGDEDQGTECCVCGEIIHQTEVILWNDDHPPHIDYICEGCDERIRSM